MATAQHSVDSFLFQCSVVDGSRPGKEIGPSIYIRVVAIEGTFYRTKPCKGVCY
jgi:hypothetical protein